MKQQPKYVILGCQGSGTNLMSRLLQQTLQFSVVHDRSLIFNAAVEISKEPTPDIIEHQFLKIRRRIFPGKIRRRFMLKRHYRQAKHFEGLPENIDTELVKQADEFANYLYAYHAYNSSASHQGIKSDDIWESLSYMDQVIPKRRYLLLVRDPRDNAISMTNKDFGPRNLYAAAEYVRFRMERYRTEIEKQKPDNVITVKYEDLLDHPQREVERVADKWNLELGEDYVDRIGKMAIRSGNQRKWEKLSGKQQQVCESILKSLIEHYEYERCGCPDVAVSDAQLAVWRTGDFAQRISQRLFKTCRNFLHP